jgi:hypothetical protein
VYRSIDKLQADLDSWIAEYNEARPHQGRWCFGKTWMQTFLDALPMTKEKVIATLSRRTPKPDRSTSHRLSDRVSANTTYHPLATQQLLTVRSCTSCRPEGDDYQYRTKERR